MIKDKFLSSMIFAAGYGKRLKPLTDHTPKPLLPLNGICCLDRHLSALRDLNVENIVVNTYHLKDQIKSHIKGNKAITVLEEDEILETGGGVKNALPFLNDVVLMLNGDIWLESYDIIIKMISSYNESIMNGLLLIIPHSKALFINSKGDYFINNATKDNTPGLITHKSFKNEKRAPFIFSGIQLWKKETLENFKSEKKHFSMIDIFHETQKNNKLYGMVFDKLWCDIGTIDAYEKLNHYLIEKEKK
ncbi:MAG: nucleotidyltransferase family protein [Proteobacteria bacterium]|nr:nucleotidyltransferase family protein [Pseudomonadota bacterium]